MSYLQMAKGAPNFSKAVISLWFRVPQESMDKARAKSEANPEGALLDGIVPLVVMGKKGSSDPDYTVTLEQTLYYNLTGVQAQLNSPHTSSDVDITERPPPYICGRARSSFSYAGGSFYTLTSQSFNNIHRVTVTGPPKPTDPTYIGVDGWGTLYVNFESGNKPSVAHWSEYKTSITPGSVFGHGPSNYSGAVPSPPGPHDAFPVGSYVYEHDFCFSPALDTGNRVVIMDTTRWEQFPVGDTVVVEHSDHWEDKSGELDVQTGAILSDNISVEADHWHHVLISVDLKTVASRSASQSESGSPTADYVSSAALLYIALDDVNYTEFDLGFYWNWGGDPNEMVTEKAGDIAGTFIHDPEGTIATYSCDISVPSSEEPVGIPATAEFVEDIYNVEMAEFQMWVGVTLDTGVESNRRAFIDKDGKPAALKEAEELIGRKPDVLLHGSSKWKRGRNTGSLGTDASGGINPAGQFQPTGGIDKYKPDPSLYGPQNPAELEAEAGAHAHGVVA